MASEGLNEPWLVILRPYLGAFKARPRNMPENTVEKKHIITMVMEIHVNRDW